MSCKSSLMKLKNTPKSYWESREQYSSGNYHCDDSDVASIRAAQANCTQTDRNDREICCRKACTDYDANHQNVDCSCDSDYGECLPSGTGGGHSVAEELKVFEDCKGLSDMNHPECIKLVTDCCNDSMIDCYDLAQPYCVYHGGGGVDPDKGKIVGKKCCRFDGKVCEQIGTCYQKECNGDGEKCYVNDSNCDNCLTDNPSGGGGGVDPDKGKIVGKKCCRFDGKVCEQIGTCYQKECNGDGEKCYVNDLNCDNCLTDNPSGGGVIPWDDEKRKYFIDTLTNLKVPQNVAECIERNVEKKYTFDKVQLDLIPPDFTSELTHQCMSNPNMGADSKPPAPSDPAKKGLSIGAIIGIIIGALIVLVALILLLMHKKVSV